MTNLNYQLDNVSCENCVKAISTLLEDLEAVVNYEVLFGRSQVKVALAEDELSRDELSAKFEELGYPVLHVKEF